MRWSGWFILNEISFSSYLFQIPIMVCTNLVPTNAFSCSSSSSSGPDPHPHLTLTVIFERLNPFITALYPSGLTPYFAPLFTLAMAVVCLILAFFIWLYVERPVSNFFRRSKPSKSEAKPEDKKKD